MTNNKLLKNIVNSNSLTHPKTSNYKIDNFENTDNIPDSSHIISEDKTVCKDSNLLYHIALQKLSLDKTIYERCKQLVANHPTKNDQADMICGNAKVKLDKSKNSLDMAYQTHEACVRNIEPFSVAGAAAGLAAEAAAAAAARAAGAAAARAAAAAAAEGAAQAAARAAATAAAEGAAAAAAKAAATAAAEAAAAAAVKAVSGTAADVAAAAAAKAAANTAAEAAAVSATKAAAAAAADSAASIASKAAAAVSTDSAALAAAKAAGDDVAVGIAEAALKKSVKTAVDTSCDAALAASRVGAGGIVDAAATAAAKTSAQVAEDAARIATSIGVSGQKTTRTAIDILKSVGSKAYQLVKNHPFVTTGLLTVAGIAIYAAVKGISFAQAVANTAQMTAAAAGELARAGAGIAGAVVAGAATGAAPALGDLFNTLFGPLTNALGSYTMPIIAVVGAVILIMLLK
jgi:hypothetical protein